MNTELFEQWRAKIADPSTALDMSHFEGSFYDPNDPRPSPAENSVRPGVTSRCALGWLLTMMPQQDGRTLSDDCAIGLDLPHKGVKDLGFPPTTSPSLRGRCTHEITRTEVLAAMDNLRDHGDPRWEEVFARSAGVAV